MLHRPPNGPALSCRPPVNHYATTDGRPASPPPTRAAGGWAAPQAPKRRPVSCSALLGGSRVSGACVPSVDIGPPLDAANESVFDLDRQIVGLPAAIEHALVL